METNTIETFELTKYFGNIKAVENINITINQGEMFYIVGPDGVGKTTLIRMLCGVILPTKGTAKILGFDILLSTWLSAAKCIHASNRSKLVKSLKLKGLLISKLKCFLTLTLLILT